MSPDGSYLIFVSNRPTVEGGEVLNGYYGSAPHSGGGGNFWRLDRVAKGWSEPVRLPDIINSNSSIYAPAIAGNGNIYFMQPDPDTHRFRLYRSRFEQGSYSKGEPLPFSDGSTSDFDPAIAADESFLIFSSNRQPAPEKHSEIFITFLRNQKWTAPVPLGPGLEGIESRLSHNGKMLYFTADHPLLKNDAETKPSAASATPVPQRIWQIPLKGLASFPHDRP